MTLEYTYIVATMFSMVWFLAIFTMVPLVLFKRLLVD